MNNPLIAKKLESLTHCLKRIETKRPQELSTLMAGCFLALETDGILPGDLSLKLQKSVGFRNVSVHEYKSIDWNIVFDIIHNHMINFKQFIKIVLSENL